MNWPLTTHPEKKVFAGAGPKRVVTDGFTVAEDRLVTAHTNHRSAHRLKHLRYDADVGTRVKVAVCAPADGEGGGGAGPEDV